jgi:hypothetical protein
MPVPLRASLAVGGSGGSQVAHTLHVFRTEGDRLAEHWGVRDELGVLVQLGLVPAPHLTLPDVA